MDLRIIVINIKEKIKNANTRLFHQASTAKRGLEYFLESTGVLPRKYWSTAKKVLAN
jgi:hypothetical protein